ncbi:AIPR family protein [Serratia marcescens]|uniref:AIPR family protein n=1 Tax=Serratia TaxID=613 RepID=UPI0013B746D3|nr:MULTISPECIES: AIPR family protein [Serratia]MEB7895126.1 AIPR family protein [Serratia ureilytica]NDY47843.1 AIPR family protein [Serratia marcescens]NDY52586.1 AIPR family protein [Serratia marcescens]NDY65072.1 AIPR family protein [Serratia marcescens]NDY69669.1 AIPR family protein [Serratia marcescens]
MEQSADEFFHDFRQELLSGAEANGRFQLDEFMETVADELVEIGITEGFELCHYRPPQGGIRVDGYWFNDEGNLDLFVADFDFRTKLTSLTKAELEATFKRLSRFFEASIESNLAVDLEITSPVYGLARQISDRRSGISSLNLILFSERMLSGTVQSLQDGEVAGVPTSYHVWDISRLQRQRSSRGRKEPLDLDFVQMFGKGIASLPAHLGADSYQSFLMVMPADALATLYGKFGARLLEQNVRTFLQARGNVNKGIRATILNEPGMFFAYNNGITATAQSVETELMDVGLTITRIVDLQIVNGGQTTASLFHTRKRNKADLSQIFVQMKLSVIDNQQSEMVVPKISEYANTQNRVNAADFFSNHPFHVRMEEFSRRIWAPALKGAPRDTRWFYERARGQYADAQSKLTTAEQRRFKAEHPKPQMFTKTDLAKFENVWDDHPKWVNLGSQKNFARYALRIGGEWEKSSDAFNEFYFKRAVARALLFRATERIVSAQPWYKGGYRANIVVYTLAMISEITKLRRASVNFLGVWNTQMVNSVLGEAITLVSRQVNDDITQPPHGISNISEWCKKEACWMRIQARTEVIANILSKEFYDELVSSDDQIAAERSAKKTQRIDNGIEAQQKVLDVSSREWGHIYQLLFERHLLTPKEEGVLRVAMQIPNKIPTERQSLILLEVLDKGRLEGIVVSK